MGGKRQQTMLEIFGRLDTQQQDALLDYAAMLVADDDSAPQPEPRPETESVVLAIKRLSRGCPVSDRRKLMGPVSLLMAQHALQGRAAAEVIDELELLFRQHHSGAARSAE
jgi:hypothetical protein